MNDLVLMIIIIFIIMHYDALFLKNSNTIIESTCHHALPLRQWLPFSVIDLKKWNWRDKVLYVIIWQKYLLSVGLSQHVSAISSLIVADWLLHYRISNNVSSSPPLKFQWLNVRHSPVRHSPIGWTPLNERRCVRDYWPKIFIVNQQQHKPRRFLRRLGRETDSAQLRVSSKRPTCRWLTSVCILLWNV